jgi:glycosyltransferase involved in cell wall biosynthesis
MIRNHIYYRLKPLMPQSLRLAIRRWFAVRKREHVKDLWPIMPGSETQPNGWPGWPDGKKFSLILTHDVEGPEGLRRCEKLMRLEMELGFRSSYNFIPEGRYRVQPELREKLTQNGFEVGIHDLKHDGHLFDSRTGFQKNATRINHYLDEWQATGFRSGFMLNNLNWLHHLDIQYDLSTFDSDPFEPQPEGRHTIFPFWVPAPATSSTLNAQLSPRNGVEASSPNIRREGYVELPYTLPQDSTLFLLLREKGPDIWIEKLEWLARHGGMALVNVHPDYICFDGETRTSLNYPVSHYVALMEHVRRRFDGQFWQPLPREVASFVTSLETRPVARRSKRICMVTHSVYESDNRVTRYAEALASRGDSVDVFALRRAPEIPMEETIQGVNVFRVQDRFSKAERSRLGYLWPLLRFLKVAARCVTKRHSQQPYDLCHIHNVPDFMVFSAWYPKLSKVSVILDIHDIVPEFSASKFGIEPEGFTFTALRWMERLSAAFADHVIIANDLWLDKYAARTKTKGRCTSFINNVDSTLFAPQPRKRQDGKLIVLFPGGLQWHQGVDIAIRAFQKVAVELPNAEFHIYGDGSAKESLIALAAELHLNGQLRFFDTLRLRDIAGVMANADLGVVPKRADSFGNEAYSTKIMEFMSVGVPVVISNTKVDRHYFDDSVVRFFESGNVDALAEAMLDLLKQPNLRQQMAARASQYAERNCWNVRRGDYLSLVDGLISGVDVHSRGFGSEAKVATEDHSKS